MSNKPELRIGDEFLVDGKAFIVDGWEVHRAINGESVMVHGVSRQQYDGVKAQIDMQQRMVVDAEAAMRRGLVG